jgi:hypothetical protein
MGEVSAKTPKLHALTNAPNASLLAIVFNRDMCSPWIYFYISFLFARAKL